MITYLRKVQKYFPLKAQINLKYSNYDLLLTSKSAMFNGDKTIHGDVIGYFEIISDEKGNNFAGFIIKITECFIKYVLIFLRSIST